MIVVVAKSIQASGKLLRSLAFGTMYGGRPETHISRQTAPALLPVASRRICNSGPADELITELMSPATKSSTTRKIVPVTVPIMTHVIIIVGPCRAALGISGSLISVILLVVLE